MAQTRYSTGVKHCIIAMGREGELLVEYDPTKAYSLDLRERVRDALDAGMSRAEAVRTFQVSLTTIKRWLNRRATCGSLAPSPRLGQAPRITADHEARLRTQLATYPDATESEHTALWNTEHKTSLSPWTLGRAIQRLRWTRKKSP